MTKLEKLEKLLTYGPTIEEHEPEGLLLLVTPRPGTISPWSSKSTDIAINCGLDKVKRLERGTAYYVETATPLNDAQIADVKALIHDRMMEVTLLTSTTQAHYSKLQNLHQWQTLTY